jgi:hypothetical protein
MNTFISHRLFVAAIGHESKRPATAPQDNSSFSAAAETARAIPLEILDSSKPTPAEAMRPLRASHPVE